MQVSESIGNEAVFFGVSLLVGAFLFFLYDILRIFRRLVKHGAIWIGIEDFLYWTVCTLAVFLMIYQENDGMVRGFAIGGVLIGMFFYYLFFSRFVIKVNVLIFGKIISGIKRVLHFLLFPFVKVGRKVLLSIGKWLKKAWKAIKMGLCKL